MHSTGMHFRYMKVGQRNQLPICVGDYNQTPKKSCLGSKGTCLNPQFWRVKEQRSGRAHWFWVLVKVYGTMVDYEEGQKPHEAQS